MCPAQPGNLGSVALAPRSHSSAPSRCPLSTCRLRKAPPIRELVELLCTVTSHRLASHDMMMGDPAASESLTAALSRAGIPLENHHFIREITSAIGIVEYQTVVNSSKIYIRAKRRDGGPDLHIAWGYTNGFCEAELVRIASGAPRRPSSRKGTWYVEHPVTRVHAGRERSRSTRREAGFCDCGMQLSLTGACANCD